MRGILHLHRTLERSLFSYPSLRSISSSAIHLHNSQPKPQTVAPPALPDTPPDHEFSISSHPNLRTRTPLEKQFESCVETLKPGFTPSDVDKVLRSQSDPDLALDIFRWTSQQRHYKHNHITYLTIIETAVRGKLHRKAETLVEEVIAGACSPSVPLYNFMIKFCCNRKPMFNRAFDIYKKMLESEDAKPTLETYNMLLNSLLTRFNKVNVCFVYLPAVKSLSKQMKVSGLIPDTFLMNMLIKAYSKCLVLDEALRVFGEMGLYGCEPNEFSYSYLINGLCEKGRVNEGLVFYKEMRGKDLVPKTSAYVILICSLALERRFDEAIGILFDMLGNGMKPDMLTYRTILEGLYREGRGGDAFELLEEMRKRDSAMNAKTYRNLLDLLRYPNRD